MKESKIILTIILSLSLLNVFSQRRFSREEYVANYKNIAIREMKAYGIPASITLAQGSLESDNGNSTLAKESNNHFGIKCKSSWQGPSVFFDDDEKNECFRKYSSVEESYIDHSSFLMSNPRYAFLFSIPATDYVAWANGLKKAGYATDPNYANRLIKIIEDYQLYIFDQLGPLAGNTSKQPKRSRAQSRSEELAIRLHRSIGLHNGLKTIVVRRGETFESIAKSVDLKEWEILHYNDYSGGQPRENEILYIESKRGKAESGNDYYIARNGDSMHTIAQIYGIRLKSLLRKNRMEPGENLAPGQKIYLRSKISKDEAAQRAMQQKAAHLQ
ncbi:MAG: glucosaminidase domain-containing protein [Bacteroidota bacterium]|nr:glucosaminidase domain-containing protein [Bacteroidota bacterium]